MSTFRMSSLLYACECVRGVPSGVAFLLPLWAPGDSGLRCRHFSPLRTFTGPYSTSQAQMKGFCWDDMQIKMENMSIVLIIGLGVFVFIALCLSCCSLCLTVSYLNCLISCHSFLSCFQYLIQVLFDVILNTTEKDLIPHKLNVFIVLLKNAI